ncbi:MAG: hypothetical protein H0U21_02760, partial [Acidimicrobiia bacterium]|nr:hypothetical protein [Acidimicrobiia bacterium]
MAARGRSQLHVLGFPLHVRPGFLLFMALIVGIHGNEFGVWLAVSIAGFTLLHEVGHAVVARSAGASAEISLDFLAGYASYRASRPLSQGRQAAIAVAGPVIHIAGGVLVLMLMGVDPLDAASREQSAATAAVWWAGPVIGAFNLVPVLPLDGGNVLSALVERVVPGRGRRMVLWLSLAVTVSAFVVFAFVEDLRPSSIFLGFLLVMQLQSVYAERDRSAASPFDAGVAAMRRGDPDAAVRAVLKGLRRPSTVPVVPTTTVCDDLARLVDLLPRPLAYGDPWNEYVLANLLVQLGEYDEAARYGAESFGRHHRTLVAATVARAAGALGDDETA